MRPVEGCQAQMHHKVSEDKYLTDFLPAWVSLYLETTIKN